MTGDPLFLLRTLGQLLGASLMGWFVVASYRYVQHRSRATGAILAVGILGRTALGLLLFWISYLELPLARSFQLYGGFWTVANDAKNYYWFSSTAVATGLFTADYASAWSPAFAVALTAWMTIVGASPLSGLFLNIVLYVVFCRLLVWLCEPANDWRRDLPCLVAVGAYSFSPVLFIHGTQILKDDLFYSVIAVLCLGLRAILQRLVYGRASDHGWMATIGAVASVILATVVITEIRWYFSIIAWLALAAILVAFVFVGRRTSLPVYLAGSIALLIAIGGAAVWRSHPTLTDVLALSSNTAGSNIPSTLTNLTSHFRLGFLMTGGNTNIVVPVASDRLAKRVAPPVVPAASTLAIPASPPAVAVPAPPIRPVGMPQTIRDHLELIATGLAVVFVPVSLLKAMSVVDFPGGGGLLAIADVDTVFQGVVILCLLVLLWQRRHLIGDRLPFVLFTVLLSFAVAVLLGYVVTNYGTLFRMRAMFVIPLWTLVVALSDRSGRSSVNELGRNPSFQ